MSGGGRADGHGDVGRHLGGVQRRPRLPAEPGGAPAPDERPAGTRAGRRTSLCADQGCGRRLPVRRSRVGAGSAPPGFSPARQPRVAEHWRNPHHRLPDHAVAQRGADPVTARLRNLRRQRVHGERSVVAQPLPWPHLHRVGPDRRHAAGRYRPRLRRAQVACAGARVRQLGVPGHRRCT